ncbi:MAG: helix-turn-helix domain-containing protein [Phycisphaerae bacterium]
MATRIDAIDVNKPSTPENGATGLELEGGDLPQNTASGMGPLDQMLTTIERREILSALGRAKGQRTLAARLLGISRSRLYRRMEALGIDPREIQPNSNA